MKSLLILLTALSAPAILSAQNADPAINILMQPGVLQVNTTGTLRVDAINTAGDTIARNSLEITVSAGNNSEITGLASSSNPFWTITYQDVGAGNSVQLRNTGGKLAEYAADNILLTVTARTAGPASTMTGNIVYVAGTNPATAAPFAAQGNTQIGNDNSTTSLAVSLSNPLPIELRSFTGRIRDCEAQLSWVLEADKSCTGFTLEQSDDGERFSRVTAIPLQRGKADYTYSLRQEAPRRFYRILLHDGSNEPGYSNVVQLKADCRNVVAGLSPNPTRGVIWLTGLSTGGTIRVYDASGVLVLQKSSSGAQLDLSTLPAGLYRVSWDTGAGMATSNVTKL